MAFSLYLFSRDLHILGQSWFRGGPCRFGPHLLVFLLLPGENRRFLTNDPSSPYKASVFSFILHNLLEISAVTYFLTEFMHLGVGVCISFEFLEDLSFSSKTICADGASELGARDCSWSL